MYARRTRLAILSFICYLLSTTSAYAPPEGIFEPSARAVVDASWDRANHANHLQITPNHLLVELLFSVDPKVVNLFTALKLNVEDLQQDVYYELFKLDAVNRPADKELAISDEYQRVLKRAEEIRKLLKEPEESLASEYSLFLALTEENTPLKAALYKPKADGKGKEAYTFEELKEVVQRLRKGESPKVAAEKKGENKHRETMKKYAVCLTDKARKKEIPPRLVNQDVIKQVINAITQPDINNVALVSDPGVGKTAMGESIAMYLVSEECDEKLKGKDLWAIDYGALLAGASKQGELETRLKELLEALKALGDISWMDEFHQLMNVGKSEGALSAADTLKPAWSRGEAPTIAATTFAEYKLYIEKDAALARRFPMVKMDAPKVDETVQILALMKPALEQWYGLEISYSALVAIAKMSDRYITDQALPAKAIVLAHATLSELRSQFVGKPRELAKIEDRINRLKILMDALKVDRLYNGTDGQRKLDKHFAQITYDQLEIELKDLNTQVAPFQAEWARAKALLAQIDMKNKERAMLLTMLEKAVAKSEYEKAAILERKKLAPLNKQLAELNAQLLECSRVRSVADRRVTADHVAMQVEKMTGIKAAKMTEAEEEKLRNMYAELSRNVIGQENAVRLVTDTYGKARAGLHDPNRPQASFLFLGSTGVGKTELVKQLAATAYDSEKSVVRIDMGEFTTKETVTQLVGPPPGYKGYEEGGKLTEAVRRKPYSVVLFDEIEKAHPAVLDILLAALDEGRLTDGQGRTVDFKNTVIIATTNVGAKYILDPSSTPEVEEVKTGSKEGEAKTETRKLTVREAVHLELKKHFRPELLMRFDEQVMFERLGIDVFRGVVEKQIRDINKNRLAHRGLTVRITDRAKEQIAQSAFKPTQGAGGARLVKADVEKLVVNELAKYVNEHKVGDGDVIEIDVKYHATIPAEGIPEDAEKLLKPVYVFTRNPGQACEVHLGENAPNVPAI